MDKRSASNVRVQETKGEGSVSSAPASNIELDIQSGTIYSLRLFSQTYFPFTGHVLVISLT